MTDLVAIDKMHQITQWILSGASEHDVVEAIHQHWPDEPARPLITKALARLAKSGEATDAALLRGFCVEAARELFRKAVEKNDIDAALRCLKAIAGFAGE